MMETYMSKKARGVKGSGSGAAEKYARWIDPYMLGVGAMEQTAADEVLLTISDASLRGLTIKMAASQVGNPFEIQDSTGAAIAYVTKDGVLSAFFKDDAYILKRVGDPDTGLYWGESNGGYFGFYWDGVGKFVFGPGLSPYEFYFRFSDAAGARSCDWYDSNEICVASIDSDGLLTFTDIPDDCIKIEHLDAIDAPADEEVFSYDSATGRGEWVPQAGETTYYIPFIAVYDPAGRTEVSVGTGQNNRGFFYYFNIPVTIIINTIYYWVQDSEGNIDIGIYNSSGDKVFSTGAFACPAVGWRSKALASPVTLQPGGYWAAFSGSLTPALLGASLQLGTQNLYTGYQAAMHPLPASVDLSASIADTRVFWFGFSNI